MGGAHVDVNKPAARGAGTPGRSGEVDSTPSGARLVLAPAPQARRDGDKDAVDFVGGIVRMPHSRSSRIEDAFDDAA